MEWVLLCVLIEMCSSGWTDQQISFLWVISVERVGVLGSIGITPQSPLCLSSPLTVRLMMCWVKPRGRAAPSTVQSRNWGDSSSSPCLKMKKQRPWSNRWPAARLRLRKLQFCIQINLFQQKEKGKWDCKGTQRGVKAVGCIRNKIVRSPWGYLGKKMVCV